MSGESYQGAEKPNHTQTPNSFYDVLLAQISSLAELKVTLAIMRQTFGWHKEEDVLSLSELQRLTGLSRQGVIDGIELGIKRRSIVRKPHGQSFVYRLRLVNELDQSKRLTSPTSQQSRPEVVNDLDQQLVNDLDPQNKEEKEKKETESIVAPATPDATSTEKVSRSRTAQAVEIFNYWKREHRKNGQTVFDAKRKRAVEARLKDGYTVDFIKQAIRGIKLDPYCSGSNPDQKIYDGLALICRDAEHLEKYAALDVSRVTPHLTKPARAAPCATCLGKGFEMIYDFESDADVKKPCRECGQKAKAGDEHF